MNTPKHIILVDDNADVRLHLGNLLLKMGYALETVEHAEQLIGRDRWPEPVVLLLDMRMPKLSGLQVQQALADRAPHVPVVFISGESRPQEIIDALKSGAVDFLIKPFGLSELGEVLARSFARAEELLQRRRRRAKAHEAWWSLSAREREVLPLLLQGHTNRSAAQVLAVQPDTIKKHRAAIHEKLMVSDLPELLTLFDGVDLHGLQQADAQALFGEP